MTEWNINSKTTRRVAICVWLSSTLAILTGCRLISRNLRIDYHINYIFLVSALMAIISLILFLNNKKRKNGKLLINKDSIIIPRFIFAEVKLSINEITFLDVRGEKAGNSYIVIGRRLRDALVISSALFSSESDMRQFLTILHVIVDGKLQRNFYRKNSFRNILKEQAITISFLIFLMVIHLFCTYFFGLKFSEVLESVSLTKVNILSADWFRYFSFAFFHIDLWHLLSNLITFSLLGRAIEGIVIRQRYINIFLLSIFAGSIISVYFSPHDHVVGASGGIMGLFGSYIVFYFKYSHSLIESKFPKRSTIFLFLILQVVVDTCFGSTDIATHLGGFFAGVAYAYLVTNDSISTASKSLNKIESILSIVFFSLFIFGFLKAIYKMVKF